MGTAALSGSASIHFVKKLKKKHRRAARKRLFYSSFQRKTAFFENFFQKKLGVKTSICLHLTAPQHLQNILNVSHCVLLHTKNEVRKMGEIDPLTNPLFLFLAGLDFSFQQRKPRRKRRKERYAMKDHIQEKTLHVNALALADAPHCAVALSPEGQSAVFAAMDEVEPDEQLRDDAAGDFSLTCGGMSSRQALTEIRAYQAGSINPFAFMIALAVHRNKQPSPARSKVIDAYLQAADDEPRMMYELWRAMKLLHGQPPGPISREQVGHVNWWKITLLMYMRKNRKPAYSIREFVQVLKANALHVDSKDIRRFCRKHKIKRDSRPGRPQKTGTP